MPSYYDSKEDKPGKAKVEYNKGGRTKTMGGFKRRKPKSEVEASSATSMFDRLRAARNSSAKGSALGQVSERELDLLARKARSGALGQISETEKKLMRISKGMAQGGKVKKMKGGGTVARGSGAARPQTFRKNG